MTNPQKAYLLVVFVCLVTPGISVSQTVNVPADVTNLLSHWNWCLTSSPSVDATVAIQRLTCTSPCDELTALSEFFHGASLPETDSETFLRARLQSIRTSADTHLLSVDMNVISDGRRIRNDIIANGSIVRSFVNNGDKEMSYEPTPNAASDSTIAPAHVTVEPAGTGIKFRDSESIIPQSKVLKLLRAATLTAAPVDVVKQGSHTTFTFHIDQFGIKGQITTDPEWAILRAKIDYPDSSLVYFFYGNVVSESHSIHERCIVSSVKRNGGRDLSGYAERVVISRVDINPTLADSVFRISLPAGALVQEFSGMDEKSRVITNDPVEDLGGVKDVSSLADSSTNPRSRSLSLLWINSLIVCVIALAIVFRLWSRKVKGETL